MSTIDRAFVEQFNNNVMHLSAQRDSRLMNTVMYKAVTGAKANFERVGAIDALQKTTRHTDTPVLDVPHSRREVVLNDYHWADLIDQEDELRMLIDPQSAYAVELVGAYHRNCDDLIIAAALGDAFDKDAAGVVTNVALPATQQVAAGGTGMTVAKVWEAREILLSNEAIDADRDELCFVLSAKEETALLQDEQLSSSDFAMIQRSINGELGGKYAGFMFRRSERLPIDTGNRQCLAYAKSGIGLAVGRDLVTRITERDDKSYAHQVYGAWTSNATRLEEEKVVEVLSVA